MNEETKKLLHHSAVDIWQGFCELHRDLYESTCDEYVSLLSGDILALEEKLKFKEKLIHNIQLKENERQELMRELNSHRPHNQKIEKASDLILYFSDIESSFDIPILKNLNDLLIDMVMKIQEQNKKNQIFLNKAMFSLNEIKQSFGGKKVYTTYDAHGLASRMSAR